MGTIRILAMGLMALAPLPVVGCAAHRQAAWDAKAPAPAPAPVAQKSQAEVDVAAGDAAWAKRDDRTQLEAALADWEKAVAANPDDGKTWTKLTQGYYELADGWISFDGDAAKPRLLATFEKGMTSAEHALMALSPPFAAKMKAGAKMEEATSLLGKDAVPALYWYTSNLGKWANAQGLITVLKYKALIQDNIERVRALDPSYFYGAADRYLGVIYAKAPAIAGGDMKKAKEHFDASLKTAPNYLATRVLWAEFFAVKVEDKAGFKRELEAVLNAPDNVIPELVPETKIEKKKARRLLDRMEDLF